LSFKMNRRNLISYLAFAATCLLWKKVPEMAYQVQFLVDLREQSEANFFDLQSKYEDNAAIDRLSRAYERKGWILKKCDFARSDQALTWTYYFKDQNYFAKWEQELYDTGIVIKDGRPYNIYRQSRYALI